MVEKGYNQISGFVMNDKWSKNDIFKEYNSKIIRIIIWGDSGTPIMSLDKIIVHLVMQQTVMHRRDTVTSVYTRC